MNERQKINVLIVVVVILVAYIVAGNLNDQPPNALESSNPMESIVSNAAPRTGEEDDNTDGWIDVQMNRYDEYDDGADDPSDWEYEDDGYYRDRGN